MRKVFYCLIVVSLLLVTGCVKTRYDWGNYDQKLYDNYRNPAGHDQFVDDLKNIITQKESSGRVPPGIFAEYGYVMYEKGNFLEAIEYFKKEQAQWPESNVLMTKMISIAQMRVAQDEKSKKELATGGDPVKEILQ